VTAGVCLLLLSLACILVGRTSKSVAKSAARTSPAWHVLGVVVVLIVAGSVVARTSIKGPPRPSDPLSGVEHVDFGFAERLGEPLTATPIKQYLPELIARTLEGTTIVVFYSPRCGVCHDLFREHFAGDVGFKVIAVDIPPPPNIHVLESDQPEAVECPSCEFMALEPGRMWLITPPTVVVVHEGKILCVGERVAADECLEQARRAAGLPLPNPAPK
jgi:hypothetical protein